MNKNALIFWGAVTLALIGLVDGYMKHGLQSLTRLIVPVVLAVVLFLLYKYLPRRFTRGGGGNQKSKVKPSQKTMAKVAGLRKSQSSSGKRKNYPFQVIEGSKGKSDEQLPKYH